MWTKRIILAVWVLGLALAFPLASNIGSVQSDAAVDHLPSGAESTEVAQLAERIPGGDGAQVLVVYHRAPALTGDDRAAADTHQRALAAQYGQGMPPQPSKDGSTLMFAVNAPQATGDEAEAAFVEQVRGAVAQHPAGLGLTVTGPSAIGADIDAVFEGVDELLMIVTTLVVAFLLIVTYRSPVLWLIPLLSVAAAALLSTAAVYVLGSATGTTVSTQSFSIMIVLVFGVGTDYALLLVARYREELRRHADPQHAMITALRSAGPAILASAGTVTLGLLCMLAAQMNDISGLGLIGAVGVLSTLVTMLTLFPAALLAAGRRVFWPRVPQYGAPEPQRSALWGRIGERVLRRPVRTATASTLILGALAVGVFTLDTTLGETGQFTSAPESVQGYQTLGAAYPEHAGRPLTVAVPAEHTDRALAVARTVPGVEADLDRTGAGWTLIEASPVALPDTQAEADTVTRLRDAVHGALGAQAKVGGQAAEQIDSRDAANRDTWLVLPLVLLSVLLVLALLLRALLASLLLVLSVVLGFGAALGLGALVFGNVFGFAGAEPTLPALCFVFGVALGVDYSIFLVARVREDLDRFGTATATRRALASTGGVIASAGVVLAATFAVLMALPFVPMVEVGFVVAAGVLLQTLVVQPLLVAPLLVRLRRWMWWPGAKTTRTPERETIAA